jgi:hypothetical protein
MTSPPQISCTMRRHRSTRFAPHFAMIVSNVIAALWPHGMPPAR